MDTTDTPHRKTIILSVVLQKIKKGSGKRLMEGRSILSALRAKRKSNTRIKIISKASLVLAPIAVPLKASLGGNELL
jgi:hypothetical protein